MIKNWVLTKYHLCSIVLFVRAVKAGQSYYARVAQLVERDLAKVEAAGSSPVSRSVKRVEMVVNTTFPLFC